MSWPFLPYGRQQVAEEDIQAVVEVLRSDWLTTGPMVERFENAIADFVAASHAVAVSSGTSALHAAMFAIGVTPGDEVVLPPMTFAATANAVLFQGGVPVFADIEPETLLLDPREVEKKITTKTKAIVAVDYAGQPCDYDALKAIAVRHGLVLVSDACHSLGAEYHGRRCGSLADITVFSFHPVKPITTGEGGMITTSNSGWADRARRFRNHGIGGDHHQRSRDGVWQYLMEDLGYNYRLSDLQCALGLSQVRKLPTWIVKRRQLAAAYQQHFAEVSGVEPLNQACDRTSGWHLYVVRTGAARREALFRNLRQQGIGANVHYLPVYLHPYYQRHLGLRPGLCPVAEAAYSEILSLPIFPAMSVQDVARVVEAMEKS